MRNMMYRSPRRWRNVWRPKSASGSTEWVPKMRLTQKAPGKLLCEWIQRKKWWPKRKCIQIISGTIVLECICIICTYVYIFIYTYTNVCVCDMYIYIYIDEDMKTTLKIQDRSSTPLVKNPINDFHIFQARCHNWEPPAWVKPSWTLQES